MKTKNIEGEKNVNWIPIAPQIQNSAVKRNENNSESPTPRNGTTRTNQNRILDLQIKITNPIIFLGRTKALRHVSLSGRNVTLKVIVQHSTLCSHDRPRHTTKIGHRIPPQEKKTKAATPPPPQNYWYHTILPYYHTTTSLLHTSLSCVTSLSLSHIPHPTQ